MPSSPETRARPPRARAKLVAPLSYGGILGALVFFGFSLTPSLLPRSPLLQGLVTGVSVAAGYGLGALVFWAASKATSWRPSPRGRRTAWIALAVAGVAFVVPWLYVGGVWNNQTRELMTLEPGSPWTPAAALPISLLIWLVLLVISRLLRWAARAVGNLLSRWVPRGGAIVLGAVIVAVPLLIAFSALLTQASSLADSMYGKTNDTTAEGATEPTSSLRSGGPGSLVTWDSLGMQGRNFTGRGPDAEEIGDFTGEPAEEPIRVYVGVESAPTAEERAQLAVKELDRTDAWSRQVLAVMGTTGTGWIEPQSADPLEYIWNGDTAEVTIQYSYLPSWISFLVDKQRAEDAGEALFAAVHERWSQLPADARPRLYAYGLSLGSFAQQAAFPDVGAVTGQTDGAVFIGTPNDTALWRAVESGRDAGSPEWQPVVGRGQSVRFAASPKDYASPPGPWNEPRLLYLQHASDPVVWWYWSILWSRPDWLAEPRGPDVNTASIWFPFVSWAQVTVDQFHGTGVPNGHGHNYGNMMVSAWAELGRPAGWTDADTAKLQQRIDGYAIE
jgi:uncharacterized membrane protein